MKTDISSREDIEKVVRRFYEIVLEDKVIGFYFSDVVPVDIEKHILLMTDFWENVLFYTGEYQGNPLETHRKIHVMHQTKKEYFSRWKVLFEETLDKLFKGPNVKRMKQHSQAISDVMQSKI